MKFKLNIVLLFRGIVCIITIIKQKDVCLLKHLLSFLNSTAPY